MSIFGNTHGDIVITCDGCGRRLEGHTGSSHPLLSDEPAWTAATCPDCQPDAPRRRFGRDDPSTGAASPGS